MSELFLSSSFGIFAYFYFMYMSVLPTYVFVPHVYAQCLRRTLALLEESHIQLRATL